MLDEDLLLVVEVLPDAFGNRHRGALQFQHGQRDAVDVEHDVGALVERVGIGRGDRDLFRDGEIVVLGMLPVDQPDVIGVLAHVRLDLHAVAQQVVNGAVALVQALARIVGGLVEDANRPFGKRLGNTGLPKIGQ